MLLMNPQWKVFCGQNGCAKTIFELEADKLKNLVAIASSPQYPTPAKRPFYSSLDTEKISKKFGLFLPTWQENLELIMGKIGRAEI